MTCGGYDEQRFLDSLTDKLVSMGCNTVGSLTIRSKQIQRETYCKPVDSYVERIQEEIDADL
jgi:hypothetical protein